MAITRAQAVAHMADATGSTLSGTIANNLVNRAGHWLCTAHDWMFLNRPASALLSTVIAQEYVTLPVDFQELKRAWQTTGFMAEIQQIDFSSLEGMRNGSITQTAYPGYCSVVNATGGLTVVSPYRLELYPTPTTVSSIRINYRWGWSILSNDAEVANLPTFLEGLYEETLAAFALGTQERDITTRGERLAVIMALPEWEAAVRSDGERHATIGRMRGGAIARELVRGPDDESWRLNHSPRITL